MDNITERGKEKKTRPRTQIKKKKDKQDRRKNKKKVPTVIAIFWLMFCPKRFVDFD
jgi:hypothetical protein